MKKTILTLALLNITNANAETLQQFNKSHTQKQQQLFASLDYCSNIGSQELFNLGTKSLDKIQKDIAIVKESFGVFKEQKTNCFDNSKDFLDSIIADNLIFMQENPEETLLELQNKIDVNLADTILLRKQINVDLIDSILADIETSLKDKKPEALTNLFITESKKTGSLMTQELNVIYSSMDAQLKLDQENLVLADELDLAKIANVSVRSAFLSLSRALLLFENIEKGPKAYNVAKIKTHLDQAHNKLLELKSYSKNLEGLDSKKDINKIISHLSIMIVDVEVTVKDLIDENFSEDFLNWAGQVYQQTSENITMLQKVLDTIYLIDITKEPYPIDITMKEEFLSFEPVQAITPPSEIIRPRTVSKEVVEITGDYKEL